MTSETETETEITEAVDTEAQDEAENEDEGEDEGEDEDEGDSDPDDSDDDSDDDSKKSKKDKKDKKDKAKKLKISFEASMPRTEAVAYFEAIVGGLRSGRLEFKQEGDTLVLNPPDQIEIEVKAVAKGAKGKVVFEIEWTDESRVLEILN